MLFLGYGCMEVGVVLLWGRCEEVVLRLKEPWRPPPLRVLRRCLRLPSTVRLFWRYSETLWLPVEDQQGLLTALALSAEQRLYAVRQDFTFSDCVRRITRRNRLPTFTKDIATDAALLDVLTRYITHLPQLTDLLTVIEVFPRHFCAFSAPLRTFPYTFIIPYLGVNVIQQILYSSTKFQNIFYFLQGFLYIIRYIET